MSTGNTAPMENGELSSQDYLALLETVRVMHDCRSLQAFPEVVTNALAGMISCNLAAYNEVNVPLGRIVSHEQPRFAGIDALLRKWEEHMAEHPVLAYYRATGDGQALAISDFVTADEFHALGIYRECYAHIQAEDQLATGFFLGDAVVVGLAFNRPERSFSARERRLLNLARPHVVQAYAAAREFDTLRAERASLQEALGSIGHGVMRFDEHGRLIECSPEAAAVLGLERRSESPQDGWLRDEWAAFAKSGETERASSPPMTPHVTIRWRRTGERVLGIVSEKPLGRLAARFGLTAREREVLHWLAEGKGNAEIGAILGIAIGTVKIHVQRVLAKLGAPNRAAAAAMIRGEQEQGRV